MAIDGVPDPKPVRNRIPDRVVYLFIAGVFIAGMIASAADPRLRDQFTFRRPASYDLRVAIIPILIYAIASGFFFSVGMLIQERTRSWRPGTPTWRSFGAGVANVAILLVDWHLDGWSDLHVAKEILLPLLLPLFVFWLDSPFTRLTRRAPS